MATKQRKSRVNRRARLVFQSREQEGAVCLEAGDEMAMYVIVVVFHAFFFGFFAPFGSLGFGTSRGLAMGHGCCRGREVAAMNSHTFFFPSRWSWRRAVAFRGGTLHASHASDGGAAMILTFPLTAPGVVGTFVPRLDSDAMPMQPEMTTERQATAMLMFPA